MVPTWWDSLPETTGYPDSWSRNLHHGVYLREFFLGALDPNEDMILHLDALATLGKVSINTIPVGPSSTKGYLMTLLPYDLDVTRAVHAGRNQIRIEIWSVKSLPGDALTSTEGPDRLLFPFGTENLVGRLGLGGWGWAATSGSAAGPRSASKTCKSSPIWAATPTPPTTGWSSMQR